MIRLGLIPVLALFLSFTSFTCVLAQGTPQEVKLKDGRILKGRVVSKSGIVTVVTDRSLFQFPQGEIAQMTPLPEDAAPAAGSPAPTPPGEGGAPLEAAPAEGAAAAGPATAETSWGSNTEAFEKPAEEAATVIDDTRNPMVTLHTSHGTITIELYEDDAPNTVASFVSLAGSGFYEGTMFHRVLKGFMMQGGDPNTKSPDSSRWGSGGPGYRFADEARPDPKLKNRRGWVSMANAGKDTNGSQFFILFRDSNYLDGKHTVFGKLTEDSMPVIDAIEEKVAVPGDPMPPREQVRIQKVTVDRKRSHEYEPKVLGE